MNKDNKPKRKARPSTQNVGEVMPSIFDKRGESAQKPEGGRGKRGGKQGGSQPKKKPEAQNKQAEGTAPANTNQTKTSGQGGQGSNGQGGQNKGRNNKRRGGAKIMTTRKAPQPAAPRVPQNILKRSPALKTDNSSKLRIIPLGGLHEVGKNLTVIECGDDMLVLDCGIAFPDDSMPGVDLVIPDFTYVVNNASKLRGIVITHGHEDHTGGIPYLLKQVNAPVYGTRLTCGLVKNKLDEHKLTATTELYQVEYGDVLTLGSFKVEIIRANHSIPDACMLGIETPAGRIIFTGDFKIDTTPIDGEMIDLARLGELGKKGVLALLSDSTNSERAGHTKSEHVVARAIDRLFETTKKRIIVTTFASNIHRVKQIIDAASKQGRKVAVSGRSMINNVNAAIALGVIDVEEGILIDIDRIKDYEPHRVVLVTTGSQGEPMSALSRMAASEHRNVEVGPDDLVIISASPIPGNEKTVSKVINGLLKRGAEVITTKQAEVHVSGHASQEEQKLVLALTKPKYFIPIHGEYSHLVAHAATAKLMGIDESRIFVSEIGRVIEMTANSCKLNGTVPSGKVLIDGIGVGDVGSVVLRDRKHLAEDGLVVVALTVDRATGELVSQPELVSRGFVFVKESEDLMDGAHDALRTALDKTLPMMPIEFGALKSAIKNALSGYIYHKTKRSPMILPVITEV